MSLVVCSTALTSHTAQGTQTPSQGTPEQGQEPRHSPRIPGTGTQPEKQLQAALSWLNHPCTAPGSSSLTSQQLRKASPAPSALPASKETLRGRARAPLAARINRRGWVGTARWTPVGVGTWGHLWGQGDACGFGDTCGCGDVGAPVGVGTPVGWQEQDALCCPRAELGQAQGSQLGRGTGAGREGSLCHPALAPGPQPHFPGTFRV